MMVVMRVGESGFKYADDANVGNNDDGDSNGGWSISILRLLVWVGLGGGSFVQASKDVWKCLKILQWLEMGVGLQNPLCLRVLCGFPSWFFSGFLPDYGCELVSLGKTRWRMGLFLLLLDVVGWLGGSSCWHVLLLASSWSSFAYACCLFGGSPLGVFVLYVFRVLPVPSLWIGGVFFWLIVWSFGPSLALTSMLGLLGVLFYWPFSLFFSCLGPLFLLGFGCSCSRTMSLLVFWLGFFLLLCFLWPCSLWLRVCCGLVLSGCVSLDPFF